MTVALKPLSEQTVVITGASSGIGLATARAAARQGAKLVLVARNEPALGDIALQINAEDGDAIYVAADVGKREQVQHVYDKAIARFGGFDTWVNDAGVDLWGRLEEVSDEDNRKLFDTNFWGIVNGSLVALPQLKRSGGALINLGSVASDYAIPLQGMYSASKHAVKAFTEALRIELEEEQAPISVTLIKPASIATPLAQHARNYMANEPDLPAPLYKPEEVADAILHAAQHPERDIYVGGASKMMSTANQLAPRAMDWISAKGMFKPQQRDVPAARTADNLYRARSAAEVYGDYPGHLIQRSLYNRMSAGISLHPLSSAAALALIGVAAALLVRPHRL